MTDEEFEVWKREMRWLKGQHKKNGDPPVMVMVAQILITIRNYLRDARRLNNRDLETMSVEDIYTIATKGHHTDLGRAMTRATESRPEA